LSYFFGHGGVGYGKKNAKSKDKGDTDLKFHNQNSLLKNLWFIFGVASLIRSPEGSHQDPFSMRAMRGPCC
jgi:hypothetical protein